MLFEAKSEAWTDATESELLDAVARKLAMACAEGRLRMLVIRKESGVRYAIPRGCFSRPNAVLEFFRDSFGASGLSEARPVDRDLGQIEACRGDAHGFDEAEFLAWLRSCHPDAKGLDEARITRGDAKPVVMMAEERAVRVL